MASGRVRGNVLLVVENEVDPAFRYFRRELCQHLPDARVFDAVREPWPSDLDGVEAVVVGGSTAGVYEAEDNPWMDRERAFVRRLVDEGVPTLGICFGHQIVNEALGGRVEHRGLTNELVEADLADDPLFEGVDPTIPAVHGDVVVEVGEGMDPIASTDYYEYFATRHREAPVWTVQYHPEFTEGLLERIVSDFGWTDTDLSFADVNAHRTLANFQRLAGLD